MGRTAWNPRSRSLASSLEAFILPSFVAMSQGRRLRSPCDLSLVLLLVLQDEGGEGKKERKLRRRKELFALLSLPFKPSRPNGIPG